MYIATPLFCTQRDYYVQPAVLVKYVGYVYFQLQKEYLFDFHILFLQRLSRKEGMLQLSSVKQMQMLLLSSVK